MQRFLIDLDFGHDDNAEQDMYGDNAEQDMYGDMEDGDNGDDDDDACNHNNTPFATHRNRIYVMPKGYFRGAPPNSLVVSKRLDIGYAEMFWLRAFLDWMYWSYLLQAHDIDPNSPFEPGRKCGGVPAAGKQPAQPCRHNHLSQGQCFVCVGAMDPENAFKNLILCKFCHRNVERAELALYEEKRDKAEAGKGPNLTNVELKRLAKLEKSRDNKREKTAERLETLKERNGCDVVQEHLRAQKRKSLSKKYDSFVGNPGERRAFLDKKADCPSNSNKKDGRHRERKNLKRYPGWFQTLLHEAVDLYCKIRNAKNGVTTGELIQVMDRLLFHHKDKLNKDLRIQGKQIVDFVDDIVDVKHIRYQKHAYEAAMEGILAPISEKYQKKRKWLGYVQGAESGKPHAEIVAMVFRRLTLSGVN